MKKLLVILAIILPLFSYCQINTDSCDCKKYIDTLSDEISGNKIAHNKDKYGSIFEDGKKVLEYSISVDNRHGEDFLIISYFLETSLCPDKYDAINFLFTDGTRIAMSNNADFNCKSHYTLYFGNLFGQISSLDNFRTKKIKAIRFNSRSSLQDINYAKEDADNFFYSVKCLSVNIKQ